MKPGNVEEGKKHVEKGLTRMERHPADGLPLKHDPKKGHGGKYTWEGPQKEFEVDAPAAIDEKDPNHVDEEVVKEEEKEFVVGEVEVPKVVEDGVARIEVDPHLKIN